MHRLEKLVCIHYVYEIRKTEHGEGAGERGVRAAHLLLKSRCIWIFQFWEVQKEAGV